MFNSTTNLISGSNSTTSFNGHNFTLINGSERFDIRKKLTPIADQLIEEEKIRKQYDERKRQGAGEHSKSNGKKHYTEKASYQKAEQQARQSQKDKAIQQLKDLSDAQPNVPLTQEKLSHRGTMAECRQEINVTKEMKKHCKDLAKRKIYMESRSCMADFAEDQFKQCMIEKCEANPTEACSRMNLKADPRPLVPEWDYKTQNKDQNSRYSRA